MRYIINYSDFAAYIHSIHFDLGFVRKAMSEGSAMEQSSPGGHWAC